MNFRRIRALALAMLLAAALALSAAADGALRYYMGDVPVNAGQDTGYAESVAIDQDDPHFGWTLGRFYVTGYTRGPDSLSVGDPVFLKNAGDTVTLWFRLDQNIDCLGGDSALTVTRDSVGYDAHFGIPKTDFGRGTLIIRHTDHENQPGEPVIYTDYLSALQTGADTCVQLFEEGDYEVALNYPLRYAPLNVFDIDLFPRIEDYRIEFRFSVRNGNCMVFPFDAATGAELANAAFTANGFTLDLARSRYLDVQIKRTVLTEGVSGMVEDVRFNRPARDGERYTEEGIYTITVRNRYTQEETVKTIYVGTDQVLQAHVTTGLSIEEITARLSAGAQVNADGTLTEPAPVLPDFPFLWIAAGVGLLALVILAVVTLRRRRNRSIVNYDGRFWW